MIFMARNHGQYDNWEGWYLRYDDNGDDDGDGEDDHVWLIDWIYWLIRTTTTIILIFWI